MGDATSSGERERSGEVDRAGRPVPQLVTGLVLIAVCVAGGLWLVLDPEPAFLALDDAWSVRALSDEDGGVSLALARFLATAGGPVLAWVLPTVVVAVLLVLRRWAASALVASSVVATALLTTLLKLVVGRARPEAMLASSETFSYPSGHSSYAAAVMVALAVVVPPVWRRLLVPLAVVVGAAMAWSRTHLAVHWLTDTIGGLALGTGVVLVLAWALHRRLSPRSGRGRRPGPTTSSVHDDPGP